MRRTLALCLALLVSGPPAVAVGDERASIAPSLPPATGEQCVEPVEIMRRKHMHFLMHQRDDTVHAGIRGAKHSLVGCIDCHVQRDAGGAAIPVDAQGQFCDACHRFAGVRMDCFGCHAAVPAGAAAGAATGAGLGAGAEAAMGDWLRAGAAFAAAADARRRAR